VNKEIGSVGGDPQRRFVPHPPSVAGLGEILKKAVMLGRVIWAGKFQRRCRLRGNGVGFNTVDVSRTIKTGTIISQPKYVPIWHAYSFEIAASVEGRRFIVDVLLHCDEDYHESPLISIVSGNFQRGRIRKSRKGKVKVSKQNDKDGSQEDADAN
jgi:hypothetical protein